MKKLIFVVSLCLGTSIASAAVNLDVSVNCFSGTETLLNGERNIVALCPRGAHVVLSEEVNGDKKLKIVKAEDLRGTDLDLTIVLENGDQFVVTSGFGPPGAKVQYFLVRNDKKLELVPDLVFITDKKNYQAIKRGSFLFATDG